MSAQQPRYSPEETARRGDEIYERTIRAAAEITHIGKVVAIDVETGAYAIDDDALRAARSLRTRHPEAEIWFVRVGYPVIHHIGGRAALGCR